VLTSDQHRDKLYTLTASDSIDWTDLAALAATTTGKPIRVGRRDAHFTDKLRQWYRTRASQPDRLDPAIVEKATGRCVGEVVLNKWDPDNDSCNFRILAGPVGQGRGLGTEATRLLVGYGFEMLLLHRISLEVYTFNPRARHVYEKVGFRVEGTLRESLRYEDQWIDATVMSVLAHEWA
jgi:RimJ/RimL family protein N-acetyltransferase